MNTKPVRSFKNIIFGAVTVLALLASATDSGAANFEDFNSIFVVLADEYTGTMKEPKSVFYDEEKKWFYIVDSGNGRLLSLDEEYKFRSALQDKLLSRPIGLVKTREGTFFVVDADRMAIIVVDVKAQKVALLKISGYGKKGFMPRSIAIDDGGDLYVTDKVNRNILKIDQDGTLLGTYTIKGKGFYGFDDVRVDSKGLVYGVDTMGAKVYVFEPGGKLKRTIGGAGILGRPVSVAIDSEGFIFVADRKPATVKVFSSFGSQLGVIAGPGLGMGSLLYPEYIYVDKSDSLIIVDGARIQVLSRVESEDTN